MNGPSSCSLGYANVLTHGFEIVLINTLKVDTVASFYAAISHSDRCFGLQVLCGNDLYCLKTKCI